MRLRVPMRKALDDLLARYDALVCPTRGALAPPIGYDFDKPPVAPGTPSPSPSPSPGPRAPAVIPAGNLAGLPALCVPNGFGKGNLPTSLQFLGRAFSEATLVALADRYQQDDGLAHEAAPPRRAGACLTRASGPPSSPAIRGAEAEPLPGDGARGLGEPRPAPVRLAHPQPRASATAARSAPPGSATGRCDGVHLCMVRLELMRLNTAPALDPGRLATCAAARRPLVEGAARAGPPAGADGPPQRASKGFRVVSWEEAYARPPRRHPGDHAPSASRST